MERWGKTTGKGFGHGCGSLAAGAWIDHFDWSFEDQERSELNAQAVLLVPTIPNYRGLLIPWRRQCALGRERCRRPRDQGRPLLHYRCHLYAKNL